MNSNITILSNIYIRAHEDLRLDAEFTSRIRGQPALKKLKTEYEDIVLTEWQENMRQNDTSCPLAENGEKTHGLVRLDGVLAWEGRCEFKECERYSGCTETAKYERNFEPLLDEFEADTQAVEFDWLQKADAPEEALHVQIVHSLDSDMAHDTISQGDDIGIYHQTDPLAEVSGKLKHALQNLPPKEANEVFSQELAKFDNVGRLDLCRFDRLAGSAAILCKTGGEAEYASHVLHRKRVPHTFLRDTQAKRSINRCIADCLWDYRRAPFISKDDLALRYRKRVNDNSEAASAFFDALMKVANPSDAVGLPPEQGPFADANQVLGLNELARGLLNQEIELPSGLLNNGINQLIVSTIHNAKDLEFDSVYLLDGGFAKDSGSTEGALSLYEAITRAKSKVYTVSPKKDLYVKCSETNASRFIQLQKYKWTSPPAYYCLHMAIGLPFDFSEAGFVKGDFLDALRMQEYIAKNVSTGDAVEIKLVGQEYQVIHKKYVIGYSRPEITAEFQKIASESRPNSKVPPSLSRAYVSNIVTIASPNDTKGAHDFFQGAKFWLGVELTGFPKIDWNATY